MHQITDRPAHCARDIRTHNGKSGLEVNLTARLQDVIDALTDPCQFDIPFNYLIISRPAARGRKYHQSLWGEVRRASAPKPHQRRAQAQDGAGPPLALSNWPPPPRLILWVGLGSLKPS
jgi:hypothetical protein